MAKPQQRRLPKTLNHDKMRALLINDGWTATIGGKHSTKMEKEGKRPITLPRHGGQDYGSDLRARLLREAGLKGSPPVGDVDEGTVSKDADRGKGTS